MDLSTSGRLPPRFVATIPADRDLLCRADTVRPLLLGPDYPTRVYRARHTAPGDNAYENTEAARASSFGPSPRFPSLAYRGAVVRARHFGRSHQWIAPRLPATEALTMCPGRRFSIRPPMREHFRSSRPRVSAPRARSSTGLSA